MYKVTIGKHLWDLENPQYIEMYFNTYCEAEAIINLMSKYNFNVMIECSTEQHDN